MSYANLLVLVIEGCFTSTLLARVDSAEEWVSADTTTMQLLPPPPPLLTATAGFGSFVVNCLFGEAQPSLN